MLNLENKVKTKLKNKLLQGSFIILVANLITAFLNYLYHFVAGRFLAPAEYGRLESIITLNYFISVFTGAFSLSVVSFIGEIKKEKTLSAVKSLSKLAIKITIIFEIVFFLLSPFIKKFLYLENNMLIYSYALWLGFSFLPLVFGAALQSRLKFVYSAAVSVLSTFLKLLITFILLLLGGKETTALSGWIVLAVVSLLINYIFVQKIWGDQKTEKIKIKKSFWKFSGLALISNFSLTSLYSSDILLVRHFFSERQSGLYSALSVLGKIIFFGASAILMVSYPLFIKYQKNKKRLKQTLLLSIGFVFSITILGIVGFRLFPDFFITALYGNQYKEAVKYMFSFAVFTGLLAIFNLMTRFLLALEEKVIGFIAAITAFMQLALIYFNHNSINAIIRNSIFSLLVGVLLSVFWIIFKLVKNGKQN